VKIVKAGQYSQSKMPRYLTRIGPNYNYYILSINQSVEKTVYFFLNFSS